MNSTLLFSAKINEFRYERDLSNYCKNQRVNKVVVIAGSGEEIFPKGPLGREMYTKLFVYAGPEHKHAAQKPEVLTF